MEDMTPRPLGYVIVTMRFAYSAPHERVEVAMPQSIFEDPPALAAAIQRHLERLREAMN